MISQYGRFRGSVMKLLIIRGATMGNTITTILAKKKTFLSVKQFNALRCERTFYNPLSDDGPIQCALDHGHNGAHKNGCFRWDH